VATSLGEIARDRLGDPARADDEFSRAERFLRRSLALASEVGDAWGAAKAKHWLALVPHERGDHVRAIAEFEEVITEFRRLGDHRQVCMIAGNIGGVSIALGDLARSRTALAESLALAQRLGYRWWMGLCLSDCANVASRSGDFERAARLVGACSVLWPETGEPLRSGPQGALDSTIAAITAVLGDEATADAIQQGATLPLAEAIAEAEAVCAAPTLPVPSGDRPAPPAMASTESLTPRERDVLRLIVEGRTDREIAGTLFISRATVSKHVGAILDKLDVPTRSGAAVAAVRRGLV
jgi:non-specific serine/threonine protein kinase